MKYYVDFTGWIAVEAESKDDAQNIFWDWVGKIQDDTPYDYYKVILETPHFRYDGTEEDED